jgi:hypothetical protein
MPKALYHNTPQAVVARPAGKGALQQPHRPRHRAPADQKKPKPLTPTQHLHSNPSPPHTSSSLHTIGAALPTAGFTCLAEPPPQHCGRITGLYGGPHTGRRSMLARMQHWRAQPQLSLPAGTRLCPYLRHKHIAAAFVVAFSAHDSVDPAGVSNRHRRQCVHTSGVLQPYHCSRVVMLLGCLSTTPPTACRHDQTIPSGACARAGGQGTLQRTPPTRATRPHCIPHSSKRLPHVSRAGNRLVAPDSSAELGLRVTQPSTMVACATWSSHP